MNLKCKINGKEYNITQGVSFSEEYNETLDSGTIIISQIKKIEDIEPYDDVFIYDKEFDGYGPKTLDYKKEIISKDETKYKAVEYLKINDNTIQVYFRIPKDFMEVYFSENVIKKNIKLDISMLSTEENLVENEVFDFLIEKDFNENFYIFCEPLGIRKKLYFEETSNWWTLNPGEVLILENCIKLKIMEFYVEFKQFFSDAVTYSDKTSLKFYSIDGERKVEIAAMIQNEIVIASTSDDYVNKDKDFRLLTFQEEEPGSAFTREIYCDIVKEGNDYFLCILSLGFKEKIVFIETKNSWCFEKEEVFINDYDEIRVINFEISAIHNYELIKQINYSTQYVYENIKEYKVLNFEKDSDKTISILAKIPNDFMKCLFGNDEILSINMSLMTFGEEDFGNAVNTYLKCDIIKEDEKYFFKIEDINFKKELILNNKSNLWEFKNEYNVDFFIGGYDDIKINDFKIIIFYDPKKRNNFYKHLLIDTINREELNFDERLFKYTINLFSETKKLEKIQLPNFSITEPLKMELKKSVYSYIVDIVDVYSPIYKTIDNPQTKTWKYQKKYIVDPKLEEIFGDVYSPDFTLSNPNLRDVLAKVMLTKDRIPYVEDDVIKAMDITARTGPFDVNYDYVNYIYSNKSSSEYCSSLKTTYSDALSQENSCRMTEYLSFRNNSTSLMTFENMRLETTYPIYKINKMYMCYYKKIYIKENINGEVKSTPKAFLCKQDISSLIKLNTERNVLSEQWAEFNKIKGVTLKDLEKYKFTTIGYDIGSKYISGWGQKLTTYAVLNWFPDVETYIEKIYKAMDGFYPFGLYSINYLRQMFKLTPSQTIDIPWGIDSQMTTYFLSPFDNQTAGYKSFFFEIEYDAFYNGTIYQSKDNVTRDGIVVNDNSGNSLALLELDGIAQKEKINRYGNETFRINARYTDFNQLQPLGSVFESKDKADEDVVIYSREYSIFENLINCKYVGAKDYVLKNYFTSVYAKHRPYQLMSYNESVYRSENKKIFLILDTDKKYIENNNDNLSFSKFYDEQEENYERINHIYKILSFFKENPLINKGIYINDEKINYGFFTFNGNKYASDINVFISGNSLCFNLKMYDNVSAGVYIKPTNIEPFTNFWQFLSVKDDVTGSLQDWYLTVDDERTGFAKTIGFYVGHVNKEKVIKEVLDKESEVIGKTKQEVEYYNAKKGKLETENINVLNEGTMFRKLFELPKLSVTDDLITNLIGNEYLINKDNKELIDMTFQIEPISNSQKVFFSPWMMKLSDLNGNYKKLYKKAVVSDGLKENDEYFNSLSFEYFQAARGYGYSEVGPGGRYRTVSDFPVIVLEFEEDLVKEIQNFFANGGESLETSISAWFKERFGKADSSRFPSEDGVIDVGKLNILFNSIIGYQSSPLSHEYMTLKGEQTISYRELFAYAVNTDYVNRLNYITDKMSIQMDFKKVTGIPIYDGKKDMYFIYPPENKVWFVFDTYEQDVKLPIKFKGKKIYYNLLNYYSDNVEPITKDKQFDETNSVRDEAFLNVPINITYLQNLFIISSSEKMKHYEVYNKYKDLKRIGLDKNDINIFVNDVLYFSENDVITVDLSSFDKQKTQSVQLWYEDENGALNFVFGVNVDEKDFEKGKVDIYVSVLTNRDLRVFDELHNVIGEVKNVANITEESEKYSDKINQKYIEKNE